MRSRRWLAVGVLSSFVLAACASDPCPVPPPPSAIAPAPTAEEMTKADQTIDRFHAAAAAANEEAYFGMFAEGGVFLGTDGTERWTVPEFRAYAHPRFASGKAWSFRSTHRDLSVHGDVVWFDESLDTPNLGPARGSGVLVRDAQGVWKVAQYNLSVPIPNERFAAVKAVIQGGKPAGAAP